MFDVVVVVEERSFFNGVVYYFASSSSVFHARAKATQKRPRIHRHFPEQNHQRDLRATDASEEARKRRVESGAGRTRVSRVGKDETDAKSDGFVPAKTERDESDSTAQRTFFSSDGNGGDGRRHVAGCRGGERFQRERFE